MTESKMNAAGMAPRIAGDAARGRLPEPPHPRTIMVRRLGITDLPAVKAVQRACYRAELIESDRSFLGKIETFPAGCLGLEGAGRIGAYCFCRPWQTGCTLPLDQDPAEEPPPDCDCLYIHDLAVIPAWRGSGAAQALLDAVLRLAGDLRFARCALVAVQGSEPFWTRWGFAPRYTLHYAPDVPATYMTREPG